MTIPSFTKGEALSAIELNTALADAVTTVAQTANTFTEHQTFDASITQTPGQGANNSTPFAQYGDLFSDAIMSGLTTTTSSTLSSTLAAGDAYVLGQRVVYPGGDYTVAASSTSYLDLSDTGVLTVSTSATVTANSLRLWTVTSSASAITGVTQVAPTQAGVPVATDPTAPVQLSQVQGVQAFSPGIANGNVASGTTYSATQSFTAPTNGVIAAVISIADSGTNGVFELLINGANVVGYQVIGTGHYLSIMWAGAQAAGTVTVELQYTTNNTDAVYISSQVLFIPAP